MSGRDWNSAIHNQFGRDEKEMAEEKKYPIAEIFTSPQGEGVYTGVMMTFIRLAGCTVGKPFPKERYEFSRETTESQPNGNLYPLSIYTEQCTLYDGRKFACDTDYRVKERLTVEEILAQVPEGVKHICISGGEPFMHDLRGFYYQAPVDVMVHVETSGTIPYGKAFGVVIDSWHDEVWITVSPKLGVRQDMLERANEIKLLVDENFDPDKLPKEVMDHKTVYLQPINYEHMVNADNLKRAMDWQQKFPQWRVSLQLHKVLEHYIRERVR